MFGSVFHALAEARCARGDEPAAVAAEDEAAALAKGST
jgi:hypothetical protein